LSLTNFKYIDLVNQPKIGKVRPSKWWWLAASDKLKEGSFRWCFPQKSKKMKKSPAIPFAKESPDSLTGNEDCLGMHVDTESAYVDDKPCNSLAGYICEVRNKQIAIHSFGMKSKLVSDCE
jgi:hypothetical protein